MQNFFLFISSLFLFACNDNSGRKETTPTYKTTGSIERLSDELDSIVSKDAKVEVIAEGFEWSEGPLWVEKHKMLLFSDVPRDTVYKWTESKGLEVYLTPSGYTDTIARGGEMGSNGLLLDDKGNLVLCQHGNRQMAIMESSIDQPAPKYRSLASHYKGKRFSSPNDAVYNTKGELFFTDPPYGLESQGDDDPKKELKWNGVYKVNREGVVILLTDSITRPNGIALTPGEKQLIVANSDPNKPNWYIFDIVDDTIANGRVFYSTANERAGKKGLPDGLKIDKKGNIFASGPGGVWILNKDAKVIGKILLDEAVSNVALSSDDKTLYVTNDMRVLRVELRQ